MHRKNKPLQKSCAREIAELQTELAVNKIYLKLHDIYYGWSVTVYVKCYSNLCVTKYFVWIQITFCEYWRTMRIEYLKARVAEVSMFADAVYEIVQFWITLSAEFILLWI
jgi:hypothetical protein